MLVYVANGRQTMKILGLTALHNTASDVTESSHISRTLLLRKTLLLALPFLTIFGIAIMSYFNHQVAANEEHARRLNEIANQDLYLTMQQN